MKGEGGVARSIIEELHSQDIKRDQMAVEGVAT